MNQVTDFEIVASEAIKNQRMAYCERLRENYELVEYYARRLNADCGFSIPYLVEYILLEKTTKRERGIIALLADKIRLDPPFEYSQLINYFSRMEGELWPV